MGNGKFEGYLLVADFDDTFCPEHGAPVPEENRRAAQHFMDEGGLFTIATGRDVRSYYSIRDKFTVNAPLVLSNGAVIFDGESGESWYESFLPFSCRSDLLAARDAFPGTGMEVHRGADVRVCGSNATLEKHLSRMGVPVSEADPGHILYPWTKVVLVAPDEIRAESETAHALCAWIAAQFPRTVRGRALRRSGGRGRRRERQGQRRAAACGVSGYSSGKHRLHRRRLERYSDAARGGPRLRAGNGAAGGFGASRRDEAQRARTLYPRRDRQA